MGKLTTPGSQNPERDEAIFRDWLWRCVTRKELAQRHDLSVGRVAEIIAREWKARRDEVAAFRASRLRE